eukprot:gene22225-biopygen14753
MRRADARARCARARTRACLLRGYGVVGRVARRGSSIGGRWGGGVGISGIFRGASRRANPRLAPRVRPPPAARPGRAEGTGGPAFQRRSRATLKFFLGVRSTFCHGWEQETWEFRPSRRDPNSRTRALSSLACQGLSRDTPNFILSVRSATYDVGVGPRGGEGVVVGPLPRPTPLSPGLLPPPTQPQRKNSTTSTLALVVVRGYIGARDLARAPRKTGDPLPPHQQLKPLAGAGGTPCCCFIPATDKSEGHTRSLTLLSLLRTLSPTYSSPSRPPGRPHVTAAATPKRPGGRGGRGAGVRAGALA